MSATKSVPVTVTDEAKAYVAEVGMQTEFEKILDHALRTTPGLRSVEVILMPAYDTKYPWVSIGAVRDMVPMDVLDPTDSDFSGWMSSTFPPEVWMRFGFLSGYEED
jgi:hypothetical protein